MITALWCEGKNREFSNLQNMINSLSYFINGYFLYFIVVLQKNRCKHFFQLDVRRKKVNASFNDALNTFSFMVIWRRTYSRGHSDSERNMGYFFQLAESL